MNAAYLMGQSDYNADKAMSDNRFRAGTDAYREWERGWMDAVRGDPLLDDDERAALLGLDAIDAEINI